jgi:lactate dehydrogenase-like 2-hydroxyacid dehydrogenase
MGLEGIDISTATQLGIAVARIPSDQTSNARSCSEHAILLALACLRNLNACREMAKSGSRLGIPTGRSLFGSKVLILGCGNIGGALAKRLRAFECSSVVAVARQLSDDVLSRMDGLVDSLVAISDLHLSAKGADVVFVCCSLNSDNQNMVDASLLKILAPQVSDLKKMEGGNGTFFFVG